MSGSFSYDGTALSDYGVYVMPDVPRPVLSPIINNLLVIPGRHGAYDYDSFYGPRNITIPCLVKSTSRANVLSYLQSVAALLDPLNGYKQLILDDQTDRYWMAKLIGEPSAILDPISGHFDLDFVAKNPFAYATSVTQSNHTITTNPDTFVETPGGNAPIEPTYKITPSTPIVAGTVIVENETKGGELQWTGSLNGTTDYLYIDVLNWIAYKNTTASMSTVTGQFPKLQGGINNSIKITGVATGALQITYRARYL